jgi:MFS family permease
VIAVAVMTAAAHGGVQAQAVRPLLRVPNRLEPLAIAPASVTTGATWSPERAEMSVRARRSIATSASVIGGAVVGAWLGYFLSQVVKSDWEGMRAGERAGYRRRFAFSGAAVGAVAGYLVRPRLNTRGVRDRQLAYFYVPPSARHYITRAELRRAPVVNALEAVQVLRREWLDPARTGATHVSMQQRASSSAPADTGIAVYVVNTRVGGVEALAEISIPEIEELRLYEPDDAERRWGLVHPRGAIEVVPAVGAPR